MTTAFLKEHSDLHGPRNRTSQSCKHWDCIAVGNVIYIERIFLTPRMLMTNGDQADAEQMQLTDLSAFKTRRPLPPQVRQFGIIFHL
jgi:hypothetical protein